MGMRKTGTISNVNETDFMTAPSLTYTHRLPSGRIVTVRERNAEDEEALSKGRDFKNGLAIPNYLSRIIVSEPTPPEQILGWPIRDKYSLMVKDRRTTFGDIVEFQLEFDDGKNGTVKENFEEDLSKYDWDYSKPFPEPGTQEFYSERIPPYPQAFGELNGWFEFKTSSGKNCKMKYLTGEGEVSVLDKDVEDIHINDKLRVRDFHIQLAGGNWQRVERFNILSAKDAMEIRKVIKDVDGDYSLRTWVKDPITRQSSQVSLLTVDGFFFP